MKDLRSNFLLRKPAACRMKRPSHVGTMKVTAKAGIVMEVRDWADRICVHKSRSQAAGLAFSSGTREFGRYLVNKLVSFAVDIFAPFMKLDEGREPILQASRRFLVREAG